MKHTGRLNLYNYINLNSDMRYSASSTTINSFFRSKFGYNLYDLSLSQCLRYRHLTAEKRSQVDCVHTLCLARSKQVSIEGFSDEELNDMIKFISVD